MSKTSSIVLKNDKRRLRNKMRKTAIKNLAKKFLQEYKQSSNTYDALKLIFQEYQSKIMKAVSKGVLQKNYASRRVSWLFKKLKMLESKTES